MAEKIKELEKKIVEKNRALDSLNHRDKGDKEKIYGIKLELDKLLFAYYKALKCKYGGNLVCWSLL